MEDIFVANTDSPGDCTFNECYFLAAGCTGSDLATIGPLSFDATTFEILVDVSTTHAIQEYCLKCKFLGNGNGNTKYESIDGQFITVAATSSQATFCTNNPPVLQTTQVTTQTTSYLASNTVVFADLDEIFSLDDSYVAAC